MSWWIVPSCAGVSLCSVQTLSVEGGVARPGLEHAGVEVEAVHLRADERVVDLLLDRPVRSVSIASSRPRQAASSCWRRAMVAAV